MRTKKNLKHFKFSDFFVRAIKLGKKIHMTFKRLSNSLSAIHIFRFNLQIIVFIAHDSNLISRQRNERKTFKKQFNFVLKLLTPNAITIMSFGFFKNGVSVNDSLWILQLFEIWKIKEFCILRGFPKCGQIDR